MNEGTFYGKLNCDITSNSPAVWERQSAAHPLNVVPEYSNVRFVRISLTKALDDKGFGTVMGTSSSGWDFLGRSEIASADREIKLNAERVLAQRIVDVAPVTMTQSTGRLLARFNIRRPTTVAAGSDYIAFSVHTDKAGSVAQGALFFGVQQPGDRMEIRDTDGKEVTDNEIRIPYANLAVHGSDGGPDVQVNGVSATSAECFVEFEFKSVLKPGVPFWVVGRPSSTGGNLYAAAAFFPGGQQGFYGVRGERVFGGEGWRSLANPSLPEGAIGQFSYTHMVVPQLALSSSGGYAVTGYLPGVPQRETNKAIIPGVSGFQTGMGGFGERMPQIGATYNNATLTSIIGEGRGNGMYVVEPVTGEHYPFVSSPGLQQTQSYVSFPTSFLARTDSVGDVVVSVVMSGGASPQGGVSNTNRLKRVSYTIATDFIRF